MEDWSLFMLTGQASTAPLPTYSKQTCPPVLPMPFTAGRPKHVSYSQPAVTCLHSLQFPHVRRFTVAGQPNPPTQQPFASLTAGSPTVPATI